MSDGHQVPNRVFLYGSPGFPLLRDLFSTVQQILRAMMQPAPIQVATNQRNHHPTTDNRYKPRVDMYKESDGYKIIFELPGLTKEDMHVEVVDGRVFVLGERRCNVSSNLKEEKKEEKIAQDSPMTDSTGLGDSHLSEDARLPERPSEYLIHEIKLGSFKRVIPLPFGTNVEEMRASMKDGFLTITFPASPSAIGKEISIS